MSIFTSSIRSCRAGYSRKPFAPVYITGVEATTGALTGTTGNTNTVTYSTHTDGKLYIENRLTSTRNIAILLFATDPA